MCKFLLIIVLMAQSLLSQQIHEYVVTGDSPWVPDSLMNGEKLVIVDFYIMNNQNKLEDPFFAAVPTDIEEDYNRNFVIARYNDVDYVLIVGVEAWNFDKGDTIEIYNSYLGKNDISVAGFFKAGEIESFDYMVNTLLMNE